MPDYPYVDPSPSPLPVGPGGTRVRVFRRRQPEEEPGDESSLGNEGDNDAAWEELLGRAVEELNAAFRRGKVPFICTLEEDEHSICLSVRREGYGQESHAVEEEVLAPGDLPRWLLRLRLRLGLLVDETA